MREKGENENKSKSNSANKAENTPKYSCKLSNCVQKNTFNNNENENNKEFKTQFFSFNYRSMQENQKVKFKQKFFTLLI